MKRKTFDRVSRSVILLIMLVFATAMVFAIVPDPKVKKKVKPTTTTTTTKKQPAASTKKQTTTKQPAKQQCAKKRRLPLRTATLRTGLLLCSIPCLLIPGYYSPVFCFSPKYRIIS